MAPGDWTVWLLRLLTAALLVFTFLPTLRSGAWLVRVCDFPRVQFAAAGLVFAVAWGAVLAYTGRSSEGMAWLGAWVAVVVWHGAAIAKYTRLWGRQVPTVSPEEADGDGVQQLIVNLDKGNDRRQEVREACAGVDPDVLVLVELDRAWSAALEPLRERYPERIESVREDGLGLGLWSKLPLEGGEVRFLVSERRPSLWTTVRLPDGRTSRLVAVHPTPPGLPRREGEGRESSRIRDAELVLVAREIQKEQGKAWVVAGDFNDVAWSRTTRLFQRLSGLGDPRVGRMLLNTFHQRHPLMRYPLDHIFVSEGFGVDGFGRFATPGSDHFGVTARLLLRVEEGPEPNADGDEEAIGQEFVEQGADDAEKPSGEAVRAS